MLNANYLKARLEPHYPVLYAGKQGPRRPRADLRPASVQAANRHRRAGRREAADGLRVPRADGLVPGARHAHGRADRERADRRARPLLRRDDCDPRARSRMSRPGESDARDNPLKHAPHTAEDCCGRRLAARLQPRGGRLSRSPISATASSGRPSRAIDNPYGDRNLVCACPPIEAYEEVSNPA